MARLGCQLNGGPAQCTRRGINVKKQTPYKKSKDDIFLTPLCFYKFKQRKYRSGRKPEEWELLGRLRHRGGNIKRYLKEGISEDAEWIILAQDKDKWRYLVNKVFQIRAP